MEVPKGRTNRLTGRIGGLFYKGQQVGSFYLWELEVKPPGKEQTFGELDWRLGWKRFRTSRSFMELCGGAVPKTLRAVFFRRPLKTTFPYSGDVSTQGMEPYLEQPEGEVIWKELTVRGVGPLATEEIRGGPVR